MAVAGAGLGAGLVPALEFCCWLCIDCANGDGVVVVDAAPTPTFTGPGLGAEVGVADPSTGLAPGPVGPTGPPEAGAGGRGGG